MPYIELRGYNDRTELEVERRDSLMGVVRDNLARGAEIDGTWEYRFASAAPNDYCEYDYILVIDMGWSAEREEKKAELASAIGRGIVDILETESFAVRLRLQNAAFVPYEATNS